MRVASGPAPVEQLGRPARRADATSDGQGDVRSPTDVVVGGDQHLLEVAPGVVASGQSALEVQPDPVLGGVRDVEHPAHAVLVAGLERVEPDPFGGQLVEERDGLIPLGDARRDRDPADRRPGAAGTDHGAVPAQVQPPQVRVEVQGVEDDLHPRLQQFAELVEAFGEDVGSDLAAAGQFGDVAPVGCCGDDAGIDGGGGHAGEHHRRPTGPVAVAGAQHRPAVGGPGGSGSELAVADRGTRSFRRQRGGPEPLRRRARPPSPPCHARRARSAGRSPWTARGRSRSAPQWRRCRRGRRRWRGRRRSRRARRPTAPGGGTATR